MRAGWSLIALVAWVLLPGVATAALVCRDRRPVSPVRALTVGMASGFSAWFLGSELLARLDLMTTTGVVVATTVVGVISLVVIVGPGRRGLKKFWRAPMLIELGVMVGAAVVVAVPLIVLVLARRDSLSGPTPWYYLGLARSVVHAHGFPSVSAEWATHLPFLDDYPGFTAGTALLLAVGGTKSMVAVQVVRLLTLVAVGASAYLFARALGAARSAAAVTLVLIFVSTTLAAKLASYRPEATSYALVFLVGALATLWMNERRNVDLILATVTLLALSEVHGVGWLFTALIVGGVAVAGTLFSPDRRLALRAGGLLVAVLIGGWLFGNLALGGGLSGAEKLRGLPVSGGDDPTWRFMNLAAGRATFGARPSASEAARRGIDRGFISLGAWWYFALVVVVVLVLLVVAWRGRGTARTSARRFLVVAVLVVGGAVAVSVWFAVRWSTYVPLRTGWGRLFPLTYALVPAAIALAITGVPGRKTRLAVAAAVLALGVVVMVHGQEFFESVDHEQPSRQDLGALRALGLKSHDLVLTNEYSEGFVSGVVGGRGVLDGRAPYSEPDTLARANDLLDESLRFFANPLTTPLPRVTDGIDYVLVATQTSALGTPYVFSTNYDMLAQRPDLKLVREGPGFRLYKVEHSAT
ncbi:MAG: hypothetical protein ACXVIM_07385 [Acidimicrobiia bacterium]